MEISNKVPPVQNTPYMQPSGKPQTPKGASPAARGDQVELSAKAKELQAAREAILKMDDVDHEKVANIKARIKAGTYKVDADKIAGKMIEESLLSDLE
ncbi:MAG: flagellar biosynthesis anti-sigma factor FlgM [Desulfobacteraceae bacterium]|jgi:negative regulator of flagellin synthesis FlgM